VELIERARSTRPGAAAYGRASKIELPEVRGESADMSKDVFKLLEELEVHIQGCRRVPMTDKVLVSEETLLDYIDQLRSLLPEELRQARLLVKDREHLIEDARVDVERILAEANQRIEGLIRESEVVKRAEAAAEEIVTQSRRTAYEIKNNATRYADDLMSSLETNLEQNLALIRSGREELDQLKRDRAVNG
jgi:vacuolar-type H+-ATPase subunit H